MAFQIEEFKSQLAYGGARPALFQIICNFPSAIGDQGAAVNKLAFMARAASIPESTVSPIAVPYFGRTIKVAGDRDFSNWAITVINDEDFSVRNPLEEWHQQLNARQENLRNPAFVGQKYKQNIDVRQFSQDGTVIKQYVLKGAWPISIGAIDLNWGAQNRIEEFNVSFAYDYWEPAVIQGRAVSPILL